MTLNLRVGSAILSALVFAFIGFAQVSDGNLVGTIIDATGSAVSNANVDLENVGTGVHNTTRTDTTGAYRFNNIPVGNYKLTASASGFGNSSVNNIPIELNKTATVNLTMEVGQLATSVTVVESAAPIDTTTAHVETLFSTRQAERLPTTGIGTLGVLNLSLLSAGVSSSGGAGYGTGPSVGGQRPTNNNFMVEGIDDNNRSVTGPVITVSNEAVAEFSLQQNQYSPEFGHSTGGQFNTIVKSGTNELHGSIYEYFQNRYITAIDQAQGRLGLKENPRADLNRLGATIGGPVIRNKWFYFGNYEYIPIGAATTNTSAILIPTASGISTLQGTPGLSKTNLDVFTQYVPQASSQFEGNTASVAGRTIPLGLLTVQGPAFQNNYNYIISSDYVVSERDQIRARYLNTRIDLLNTNSVNLPFFFTPIKIRQHLASLSEYHTFSPSITNELRLGYVRNVEDRPAGDFTFPGLDVLPNLSFNDLGLSIGPNPNYPQSGRFNTFQLNENLNWTKGRHSLKFGYDGRKLNISNFFVQRNRGDYQYATLERYLMDLTPTFAERSVGGFPFVGNLLSHYAYANDEFRLRPNLTINLGVRYEFVGVPFGAQQQSLNALSSVPGLIDFRAPRSTKNDWAPRIGLAWSPGTSGHTSIRAGFGLAYDQIYQNLGTNSLAPQFFTTIDAHINSPDQPNFLANGGIRNFAPPITSPAIARSLTSSYIPDQTRPYSLQWNLGVQHVFAHDYTAEVRYLGTRGVHLPYQVQMNRPAAVTAANSLPTFMSAPSQATLDGMTRTLASIRASAPVDPLTAAGFTTTLTTFLPRGNSHYNGLAAQFTKRYSKGFTYSAAYTWSHNIDDSTAALNSTVLSPRRPQDFNDLAAEKANSALDHRHRLTANWVYEPQWYQTNSHWMLKNLVGNWTFSGTYIAETGTWATVRSGIDSNQNGDPAADRTIINPAGDPHLGSNVTPLCRGTGACTSTTADRIVGYLAVNPNARYIVAGAGVYPTGGRNTLRLPGINNFDLTLGKRFNITERKSIEFRAEAYNALNHPQYVPGFPSVANLRSRTTGSASTFTIANSPLFDRPDLVYTSNSRLLQLVARIVF